MSNEQEKKKFEEEEKDSVEFIFEGVFKAEENKQLYEKYKSFTKKLNDIKKGNYPFNLNDEEIKSIFKGLENVIVKYCEINEELEFYEIVLNYDFKKINYDKIYNLKKTEYNFIYKETKYYCFLISSMTIYLENLLKDTDFFFEISYEIFGRNRIKDITQFMMSNLTDFKIMISYQFKEIDYKNINYDSMFKSSNVISGEELNLKLGHYVSLTEEQYKEFNYFHTEERENFFRKIFSVLGVRNVIGICGPYGTGKTITLLRMIIKDPRNKCFYVNLASVNKLPLEELKKTLKYEIMKLYSKKLIFPDENPLYKVNKFACDQSLNLIDKFDGKNIFKLLKDMIFYIKDTDFQKIYFIIDQYSSKFDIDKNGIKNLLDFFENFEVKQKKKIKIIICSSMDNYSVKSDLCECLSEELIFPKFQVENSFIFYLYVGSLVRLNELENYNMLIQDESDEFIKYLNYFGNLPFYYYYLKNAEQRKKFFYSSVVDEKDKIIDEIKNFYQDNNKQIPYNMITKIMNIILYINKKEIFFWKELSLIISILPMKFLEIKKETIFVNDLKLYGLIAGDKKVLQYIKNLEKSNNAQDLQNNEYILGNYSNFIKEEKYCNNFISKITEKDKKKLNYAKTNFDNKMTIFYLDYLFPLMEEIFSNLIYQIYSKSSHILYSELPCQTQDTFLELMIYEYIKRNKELFYIGINDFEIIENFVPNEFYIQDYITWKNYTIRIYIENQNFKCFKKKKLPKKIIFIQQIRNTAKYYDCALLIPLKSSSGYILVLFQIYKKEFESQLYYKEEHMIIINRVKSKLENEFDIEIKEAHFSYILNNDEEDKETIEFCQNNNLNYYLFSFNNLSFDSLKSPFLNEKTLVTKDFPFHSSFSILQEDKFDIKNGMLANYEYIKTIQKKLIFEDIENDLEKLLDKKYELINDLAKNDKNTFKIFGHFDEIFEVNDSFCIWFDNNDFSIYYNNNNIYEKLGKKFPKKLSNKNFSLICSKYSITKKN